MVFRQPFLSLTKSAQIFAGQCMSQCGMRHFKDREHSVITAVETAPLIELILSFKNEHYVHPWLCLILIKKSLSPRGALSITKCSWTGGDVIIVPPSILYHNLIPRDTISWEDLFCHHAAPHSHSAEMEVIFILFFPKLTFRGSVIIIQPEISWAVPN